MYHDPRRSQFIQSGKRTGGYDKSQSPTNPTPPAMWGFAGRGNEHEKAAKADKSSSNFYDLYPSKHSHRATKRGKKGFHENLSFVIAAGFDPKSDTAKNLNKDWSEGGILILSDDDKVLIKKSMGKDMSPLQKSTRLLVINSSLVMILPSALD